VSELEISAGSAVCCPASSLGFNVDFLQPVHSHPRDSVAALSIRKFTVGWEDEVIARSSWRTLGESAPATIRPVGLGCGKKRQVDSLFFLGNVDAIDLSSSSL